MPVFSSKMHLDIHEVNAFQPFGKNSMNKTPPPQSKHQLLTDSINLHTHRVENSTIVRLRDFLSLNMVVSETKQPYLRQSQ